MSDKSYDLVVIGAGPGGYVAAIRGAQLGMKVACVDKRSEPGGTCLNVGCIPSKALLQASEHYDQAKHHLDAFGVETGAVKLNLKKMMEHKDSVVSDNTKGIRFLFKKNKIDYYEGAAAFESAGKIKVALNAGGEEVLEAKKTVIATGSDSAPLPGVEVDEKDIVSSTGALDFPKVPKHLVVIGAGVIGLEMGSVWARLGAKVTVIEFLDFITPGMDAEIQKNFQRILKKQGFDFKLKSKVTGVEKQKTKLKVTYEPRDGGDAESIDCDKVLLAIGRRPYTEGLGLDKVGITVNERGQIPIDENFETAAKGVYAIGDVVEGAMLAHKAEDEGVACVERMQGQKTHIDYDAIPGVIYTEPEVAAVGKTEAQLKEAGVDYVVGKFPFSANGRARAANMTEGFVKLLADKKTDRLLGAHIIGQNAGTMIAELGLAIEFQSTAEDVARSCHAHPTLPEAIKEAALAVDKRTIHM